MTTRTRDPEFLTKTAATWPARHLAISRWSDNDMYGHMNNAVYYELFDSAINTWHAEQGIARVGPQAVVARSSCTFNHSLSFPGPVTIGFGVRRIGRSSVTYALAAYAGDAESTRSTPAALGDWVHVYVDPSSRGPMDIPDGIRSALTALTLDLP